MAKVFRMQRRVAWRDTDWVGVICYPNIFHYFDDCENEFFRAHGVSKLDLYYKDEMFFPRIAANAEFKSMLKYDDVITTELRVSRLGEKSVGFAYRCYRDADGVLAAEGSTLLCLVNRQGTSIPIPRRLRSILEPYLQDASRDGSPSQDASAGAAGGGARQTS